MNRTGLFLFSIASLLGGCSLINSFDDVKREAEGSGGGGGRDGGADSSGMGGADAGPEASAGGMTPADATAEAPDASEAGTDGAAGDGATDGATGEPHDAAEDAFVSGGPNGAIVAYDGEKLWVLNPETGKGLSSETFGTIAAMAHDPSTDYWYLFEQTGALDEPHVLHVRELNTTTGVWNELGDADVPAPATSTGVGVLNNRIAYLSYPATGRETRFTVLNTANSADVVVVGSPNRELPRGNVIELVAARGRSTGGLFTVMLQDCLTGAVLDGGVPQCDIKLAGFVVSEVGISPSSAGAKGVVTVGGVSTVGGGAGLTFDPLDEALVVVLPPTDIPLNSPACAAAAATEGSVTKYSPSTLAPVGPVRPFRVQSRRIQRVAQAPCSNAVVATTFNFDNALFVVPFVDKGTPGKQCVPDVTGGLVYEPYTRYLLRTVDGDLQGWEVSGPEGEPVIRRRTLSSLPNGFRTSIFAVRQPANLACD